MKYNGWLKMSMIRINLYGGPSSGKTTLSALLFAELKLRHKSVELVREFAKEMVYQDFDMHNLREPIRIFIMAEQMRRESILHNKVDFLITDSPVLIAAYYYNDPHAVALAKNMLYDGELHFFIKRDENMPFEKYGRAHNEEESKKIDNDMKNFLIKENIDFFEISGNTEDKISQILSHIGINDGTVIKVRKE